MPFSGLHRWAAKAWEGEGGDCGGQSGGDFGDVRFLAAIAVGVEAWVACWRIGGRVLPHA
jgi:hypothetical protein